MVDYEPAHIEIFLEDRSADLKRIARSTKGDASFEELGSEAWLIALKIGERRGFATDFADLDDQEQVLAWLYKRFVDYADKRMHYAARLDDDSEDEEGSSVGSVLARLLAAPEASDPLILLQTTEEQKDYLAMVRSRYSQATAYVLLLLRLGRDELAAYLLIGRATLANRIRRAADWFGVQPSMFDGIEVIDEDFMPAPGRPRPAKKPPGYVRRSWDLWPSNAWAPSGSEAG